MTSGIVPFGGVEASATTSILLVRHGQSAWNAEGRWQGQADPPLSPLGELQAEEAARRVHGVLDAVWSSDLRRAAQTAARLGAVSGLEPRLDADLRGRHAA